MPTALSKFLERAEGARQQLKIPRSYMTGAVVAAALLTYTYKIGYPLVESYIHRTNTQQDSVNNNLLVTKSNLNGVTQSNGKNGKKAQDGLMKYNRKKCVKLSYLEKILMKIPGVNHQFIIQFLRLLGVMVPGILSAEVALLCGHTSFLFLRTFLSIYIANLEGAIVKYIVRKEPKNFAKQLLKWFAIAVPATFINSMIRYLESRIALSLRTRLVEHSYQLYFKNQSYYRVTVLDGRLDNCSQRLTDEIETVATMVSHLYGQITKPLFDILLMSIALANLAKSRDANLITGPILITSVVIVSALILKLVSPRFGQLVAQEAEKKGYLRHVHSRLVTNAEEIAFYGGHKVELTHLRSAYRVLAQHLQHMFKVKLWFVMLEQFLMKYVWSGAGIVVVSLPILLAGSKRVEQIQEDVKTSIADSLPALTSSGDTEGGASLSLFNAKPAKTSDSISERTHYFTTAKNLLMTGGNAVERLMSSYKDIVELAGHTGRVANMFTVLEEVSQGIYEKTLVEKKDSAGDGFEIEFKNGQPISKGKLVYTATNELILKEVPIVTPNCDVVCSSLSLHLKPGEHLLITGPNGCGKSSLFRILAGLWPIYGGELHTPKNAMFYIPQRPYMVIGNLRDQIIYPDTHVDMINKQKSEEDLIKIMRIVHLDHVVERDGFYALKDWTDILSGGEKQRMALARLFYHKPKYALLDECTSAISIDVEGEIYEAAIESGITLLTITHRPTLWKFHTHLLQFDGAGSWTFSKLNYSNILELKKEKEELLNRGLTELNSSRLREINRLLGEDESDSNLK